MRFDQRHTVSRPWGVYRWRLSQENLVVASQIQQLAHRLGVPDVDRWCAGVLAQARQRGMPDGPDLLQAAQLAVLARQTESPAASAVLSVPEIRQLADARSRAQPAVDAAAGASPQNRRTGAATATPASDGVAQSALTLAMAPLRAQAAQANLEYDITPPGSKTRGLVQTAAQQTTPRTTPETPPKTPPGSSVGAMAAGFNAPTPPEFDAATDLSHLTFEQARAYAEGQPETSTFSWTEPVDPADPSADAETLLFRGGQPAPMPLTTAPVQPLDAVQSEAPLAYERSAILDQRGTPLPTAAALEWTGFKQEFPDVADAIRNKLENTLYSGVQVLDLARQRGISPIEAADLLLRLATPNQAADAPLNQAQAPLSPHQLQQLKQQAAERAQRSDLTNQLTGGGRWIADPLDLNKQYWAPRGASESATVERARARNESGWESLPFDHPDRQLSGEPGRFVQDPLDSNRSFWAPKGMTDSMAVHLGTRARAATPRILESTGYPGQHRDVHQHHDPLGAGSYDPLFTLSVDNFGKLLRPLSRLLNLGDGNNTAVNVFPVAPGMNPGSQFPFGERQLDGSASAEYYGMQNARFAPMIGSAMRVGDDLWRLEGIQSPLYRGQRVELPSVVVTATEIEQALGRALPDNLDRFDFAVLPINCHAGMSYRGAELDVALMEEILKLPPQQRTRVYQGLTTGDPFANYSDREVWNTLRAANALEMKYDGKLGGLNINGFGEITIAKELVLETLGRNPLFLSSQEELAHLSRYLATMEQAGGLVIIHADAGSSGSIEGRVPMLPTDYANMSRLEALLNQHPDLQVIWAHGGGLGRTIQPGSGHLNLLRGMLDRHANLKIDTSWDVINAYMVKSPQAMRDWARLIHEYPDRFIFGSDAVGAGVNPNTHAQFTGLDLMIQTGLLHELNALDVASGRELRSSTAGLLFNNFDATLPPAEQRLTAWRTHPLVVAWLDRRGYDQGEPPPMIYQRNKTGNLVLTANPIQASGGPMQP